MRDSKRLVRRLIGKAGRTYAEQSGIRLKDKPMPLFQLLVLAMLASKPIGADVAAQAARELFKTGLRSPKAVVEGDRRTVIAAFGRAGYARYDESSADRLCDMAIRVRSEFAGDLRNLGVRAGHDVDRVGEELRAFNGIGPTGADVFLREVQVVWSWVRPHFDQRALDAARALDLPATPEGLGALAPRRNAQLAVALVRVSLDDDLREFFKGHRDGHRVL
jgi:endonuclease III